MSSLFVEDVVKSFGGVNVLRRVTLEARQGLVTAIIGPNGAGKSTLANVISGLVSPDAGRIRLDGTDITAVPAYRRARLGIGRTFQNLQLFGGMTVAENVALGGYRWRAGRGRDRARDHAAMVSSAMAEMNLQPLAGREVEALGFGQAKLVEPARVLAMDPSVLVMDEPAAGLSASGVGLLKPWIAGRAQAGVAVVLIEHNMRLVMELSDYVYVLDHGVVIAQGTPAEVRVNPLVLEAYLGHGEDEDGHAPEPGPEATSE